MNFFLLCIFTHFSLYHSAGNDNRFYALTLRRRYDLKTRKYQHFLPDGGVKVAYEVHYAKNDEHEIHLCPVQSEEERNLVQHYENSEYCLLIKEFTRGAAKTCAKEAEPVIKLLPNKGKPRQCGKEIPNRPLNNGYPEEEKVDEIIQNIPQNRLLYSISYMDCTSARRTTERRLQKTDSEEDNSAISDVVYIQLYNFCYDNEAKTTIYVEYILYPKNFIIKGIDDQLEYNSPEFSTPPFFFENAPFSELKKAYNDQKDSSIRMIPHTLVSKSHMSFALWKKTTNHIVNTAALWDKLVELVEFIDDRLLFLAKTEQNILQIYTTAYYHQFGSSKPTYLDKDKKFLVPNIWCKVAVYHLQSHDLAVAIIIQNTPNLTPNMAICDKPIECEFNRWPNGKKIGSLTNFAHCCMVTKLVQDLFPISLPDLKAVFDLNTVFADPEERKLQARRMRLY